MHVPRFVAVLRGAPQLALAALVLGACGVAEPQDELPSASEVPDVLSIPPETESERGLDLSDDGVATGEWLPGFVGVVVEGPGFSVELPVEGDLFSVGFHADQPDENAGALLSDSQFGSAVIVWQSGHSEPAEAMAGAYQRLNERGLDAAPDAAVEFTLSEGLGSDHHVAAENVTLGSSLGEATGIAVVWTCDEPDRTFAMMVYDGDEQTQFGLAQTILASFNCAPAA